MPTIGPFQPSDIARITLEIKLNGTPIAGANPRVQRIIMPNGQDIPGYPRPMFAVKTGTYMLETSFSMVGNYTAFLQAEVGSSTMEQIAEFVVERPYGYPRIEVASDD